MESGRKLIAELKKLFGFLAMGNKKYVDPSGVLRSIIDDFGQPIQIGEEKDIREFNEVLLGRISDALNFNLDKDAIEVPHENAVPLQNNPNMGAPALETQTSFIDEEEKKEE